MTTDEKKEALIGAGVKLRSNASDEKINEEYAEWASEHGPVEPELTPDELEEIEEVNTPIVETPKTPKASSRLESFQAFIEAHGSISAGDKTPAVVEWARANLTPEEFDARYKGRLKA